MANAAKQARMVLYIMGVCLVSFAAGIFPTAVHPIRRGRYGILTHRFDSRVVAKGVEPGWITRFCKAGVSAAGYNS
jgi:hypothetical protein